EMIFLQDGEIAIVGSDGVEIKNSKSECMCRVPENITWTAEMAEKEGFAHFMLKEIHEQPRAIRDTLRGRIGADDTIDLDGGLRTAECLANIARLHIVAMGTSLHAAHVGKFSIESLA